MPDQPFRVLFLSRRNAARGLIAEALANAIGHGQFSAFSAGVHPAAAADPVVLEVLEHAGISPPDHAPRHVREFSAPDSPPFDFVFTLSDTAAGEAPPSWPGHPITAHWRCVDPDQFEDAAEHRAALMRTRAELERRLRLLANLPMRSLDRISLQTQLDGMGRDAHSF